MRISDWSADVCSTDLWRALGQLSANLLAGRAHQLRRPPQQAVEFCEMSRLIIVSNRVQQPVAEGAGKQRSEEHTSELQSLMRISYAVYCLKKKKKHSIS